MRDEPSVVFVLIGTNDVVARTNRRRERGYIRVKKLPRRPEFPWFFEQYDRLVGDRCKATNAAVFLISIPPIGEDVDSETNRMTACYAEAIREIAERHAVGYVPFHEALRSELAKHPAAGTPLLAGRLASLKTKLARSVLRWSYDDIARFRRYFVTVDGVHLNGRGAQILVDLIAERLDGVRS